MFIPVGDEKHRQMTPVVTWGIIALNLLAYGATRAVGSGEEGVLVVSRVFGLVPHPEHFRVWTLLTYSFFHTSVGHLFFNLLYLYITGDNVEDEVGHLAFAALYLLMGAAAGMIQVLAMPGATQPFVGASGAVSGVLGAYAVCFPHNRVHIVYWWVFVPVATFRVAAGWVFALWFGVQVLTAAGPGEAGVAVWAHVGGFATGMLVAGIVRGGWRPGVQVPLLQRVLDRPDAVAGWSLEPSRAGPPVVLLRADLARRVPGELLERMEALGGEPAEVVRRRLARGSPALGLGVPGPVAVPLVAEARARGCVVLAVVPAPPGEPVEVVRGSAAGRSLRLEPESPPGTEADLRWRSLRLAVGGLVPDGPGERLEIHLLGGDPLLRFRVVEGRYRHAADGKRWWHRRGTDLTRLTREILRRSPGVLVDRTVQAVASRARRDRCLRFSSREELDAYCGWLLGVMVAVDPGARRT